MYILQLHPMTNSPIPICTMISAHWLRAGSKRPLIPARGQPAQPLPARIIYPPIEQYPASNKAEVLSGQQERPELSERELPLWRGPLDVLVGTKLAHGCSAPHRSKYD